MAQETIIITKLEESGKTSIVNILASQVATIKFTKIDGSVREMKATLSSEFTPAVIVVENTESKPNRKSNPDIRTVYDVDAKAWKSFRWDKLISITYGE